MTKWREKHFGKRRNFSGREDYMESKTYLMGSETSNVVSYKPLRNSPTKRFDLQTLMKYIIFSSIGQNFTIQTGKHTYNFACKLPENCPTSFEGLHGCVRYIVKVTLLIPWKFNQTYTRGFTVLKMLDLNYESPQLKVCVSDIFVLIICI